MKANVLPKDPRDLSVQVQFRCPFWYRAQLVEFASARGLTLSELISTVVEEAVPPVRPGS